MDDLAKISPKTLDFDALLGELDSCCKKCGHGTPEFNRTLNLMNLARKTRDSPNRASQNSLYRDELLILNYQVELYNMFVARNIK